MAAVVTVGLDLGQKVDPSALCVAEQEWRDDGDGGRRRDHFLIRTLERLPLGMAYPKVAERVAEVVRKVGERTKATPRLYVDATGVGTPVCDCLTAAGLQAVLTPCYFTHGDRRTQEKGQINIGKAWLVSRLQALLQGGQIHLPRGRHTPILVKELLDYEIRIDTNANDLYGAFKVGAHDDLVTALGLAVQSAGVGFLPVALTGDVRHAPLSAHDPFRGRGRHYSSAVFWSAKTRWPTEDP